MSSIEVCGEMPHECVYVVVDRTIQTQKRTLSESDGERNQGSWTKGYLVKDLLTTLRLTVCVFELYLSKYA